MRRPVDLQLAASPSFNGILANPSKSFALLVQIEFLTTARDLPLSHPIPIEEDVLPSASNQQQQSYQRNSSCVQGRDPLGLESFGSSLGTRSIRIPRVLKILL